MNITRLNFSQTLPYIKDIIKQSQYVSIDLQMSGIVADSQSNPSLVDSVQERYLKTKKRIQKFIPLQLGLCFHSINSQTNKVIFYPFNFYIYPLSINEADSIKFSFHAASLNFLAKNSFDFNKLFYEHVPFISKQQLTNIDERKEKNQLIKQLLRLDSLTSPTTKAFLNMTLPIVEKWISENSDSQLKINIQYMKFKSYKALMNQIERIYPSISFQFSFDSQQIFNRKEITIRKNSVANNHQNTLLDFGQQSKQNQHMLMNQVIECIVQNRLAVIVHNGFLDMMHIYLRFIQKLPPNWKSFCRKIHKIFPSIYDTKFICSNFPVLFQTLQKMTNLQNCYLKLKQDYEKNDEASRSQLYSLQIHESFKQYSLEAGASHEAGFDALMTGYVFFRSMNKLKKSLETLKKPDFQKNPSLMRNKIPMGNLKVPLNFEQLNDSYTQHGNQIFEAQSLLNTLHTEEQITEHFKKKEGAVNFFWKDDGRTSFFVTFIDEKDQQIFSKKYLDQDGLSIIPFLNDKYLFRSLKRNNNQVDLKNQLV